MRLANRLVVTALIAIGSSMACGGDDDGGPSGTSVCGNFSLSSDQTELWYNGTVVLAGGVNGATVDFSTNGGPTTHIVANATRTGSAVRIIASWSATVNGTQCSGP